jgi:hypothetical protein
MSADAGIAGLRVGVVPAAMARERNENVDIFMPNENAGGAGGENLALQAHGREEPAPIVRRKDSRTHRIRKALSEEERLKKNVSMFFRCLLVWR